MARQLEPKLKQTIVVENKTGAGGYIAVNSVMNSAPDGYTLLCTAELALYSDLFDKTQRAISQELPLIAAFGSTPHFLLASTALGVKTLPELITSVRANPKKFNTGFAVNSTYMLEIMDFLRKNRLEMGEIAYSTTPQSMQALLTGDIHVALTTMLSARPVLERGRAVLIGTTGARRFSLTPNVPTLKEQGVDVDATTWFGLFGSAKLPARVRATLERAVTEAMSSQEAASALAVLGTEPLPVGPDELRRKVAENARRYQKLLDPTR